MPKVPPKPAALGKQPKKKLAGGPGIPVERPLSLEERTELAGIFASATFIKAFSNARLRKPSAIVGGLGSQFGGQIATATLCRIQGWEMFEAAMFLQTQDRPPPREQLRETFNDPELNNK